ncbi:hypothetical protein EOL99_03600 [Candidatus Falkowbacteria bacterium]|nr:hypothetical protein [Candidatus Falkowbacteria bacterium]
MIGVSAFTIKTVAMSSRKKCIEDDFEPAFGTIVYCNIGPVEHSGVYIRNGKIAQLNGNGKIELVSPRQFTDSISTLNKKIMVPFPKDHLWEYGTSVSSYATGERALSMIGDKRDYNFILDNCHQFCAGCITGKFDNEINFLFFLKNLIQQVEYIGEPITWFEWDWEYKKLLRQEPL